MYITVLFEKYSFYLLKSTHCKKYPVINSNKNDSTIEFTVKRLQSTSIAFNRLMKYMRNSAALVTHTLFCQPSNEKKNKANRLYYCLYSV